MTGAWAGGGWVGALADWLEQTPLAEGIAESRYWWPILEGTHLLSLSLSVGLIVLTDLRLLGIILLEVPVTDVLRQLRPYVLGAFGVTFLSGMIVFWSEAGSIVTSPFWPLKLLLITLGGLNALYFEFFTARQPDMLRTGPLPRRARGAALASLSIWGLVIICGRLLAYVVRH